VPILDERFEDEEEITVDDVSDNLQFFIFHQFQNQVYELHFDRESSMYVFRVLATFTLVPNPNDQAYLEVWRRNSLSSL